MELGGYAGNILYINLTDGSVRRQPLDADLVKKYIGGAGINNKLAYDLIPPDTDPLSPQNTIILGTGPFNGTFIPGASQTMSVYKSPLNNSFPHSNGGGIFSHYLKSSGYDHLAIMGKSGKPVYLVIEDDNISLRDASDLWGMDGYDVTDELRRRHSPCSIIPIGPAGERQVAISVTHIDKVGTIGSGGLAAVMGSKNLKAIVACMGSKTIEVADPKRLQKLVDEILEKINSYHLRAEMLQGGAMTMTKDWIPPGMVARNSSELIPYPTEAGDIKAQIYEFHKQNRKKIACATCPMSDKDRIDFPDRGLKFYDTAVFAEMAIMTVSKGLGYVREGSPADRYALALQYYDDTNRYGIDRVYSFHGLADFVITLYEQGIINKSDTGGLELDRNYETLSKLLRMTAMREGFGDILADGVVHAAKRIGKGAEEHVQNVIKGQFVAFDPRMTGFLPMHLGMMVHPGRTLPVSAAMGAPSYSPGWPIKQLKKQAERCGVPPDIDRLFTEDSFNLGRLAKHAEDFFGLFNMLGQCHRLYISRFYSLQTLAELYSAVTGINATAADLKQASSSMWNMWRLLNARASFTSKDDEPPEIWFKPLKSPDREYSLYDYFLKRELTRKDVDGYLDEYYDERGWEKEFVDH